MYGVTALEASYRHADEADTVPMSSLYTAAAHATL